VFTCCSRVTFGAELWPIGEFEITATIRKRQSAPNVKVEIFAANAIGLPLGHDYFHLEIKPDFVCFFQ